MAPTGAPPSRNIRVSRCSYGGARIASESSRNEAIRSRPTFVDKVVDIRSTVIVLLACGIGITCAVFDLVYSVILRPFPYPEQERSVQIWETSRTREKGPVSLPDYEDMRRNQRTLEDAALMQNNSANVVWNGSPIPVPVHYFKAALFNVLKLNPILGRTFSEQQEHESKPVALVSEQFWKKRLDSRSDAVGQQLQIDARTFTIVGILPNTIKELWLGDIFLPMSFNPRLGLYLENREAYGFWSIGATSTRSHNSKGQCRSRCDFV